MKRFRLGVVLTSICAWAGVTPIPFGVSDRSISGRNQYGDVQIQTQELLLDLVYSSGMTGRGDLVVMFEQTTGQYLWHFVELRRGEFPTQSLADGYLKESKIFVASDRMVMFHAQTGSILIRESVTRAGSLRAAVAAASQELDMALGEIEKGSSGSYFKKYVPVSLRLLGNDFLNPHRRAVLDSIKILDVMRLEENWQLTLQVESGANVALNSKYELLRVERPR